MSSKIYTIAFVPLDAFGHVNACLGLATNVRERGHKCVFIANQNWKDLISKHDFECYMYIEEHKLGGKGSLNDFIIEIGPIMNLSSFDKIRKFEAPGWPNMTSDVKLFNHKLKEILQNIKPNAIVVDSLLSIPAVTTSGIPWIDLCSCSPLYCLSDENLPPGGSGYPTNGDKNMWKTFREELIDAYSEEWNSFSSWMTSIGAPPLKYGTLFKNESPFLNVFLCPQELCYYERADPHLTKRFFIDSLIREEKESTEFVIPEQLKELPGKLIYISMGTICCSDLTLMRRLLSILKNSKNRIIVSKGPLGDQLELSDNMWGQNSLPQLQVIPAVDLVITHGGNNTVTESLYFGKPMIVLPVFADQYDNAQQIQDKGLGLRLDPYFCTETQLLEAIEKLANDSDLKERYQQISQRIKGSKSRETAAKLIEQIITNWINEQN